MKKIISLMVMVCFLIIGKFNYAGAQVLEQKKTTIRIAYPTATLVNGQIGQVLLKTNILERNNLKGRVEGFQYGPPMMEALVSDKVDVAFTSEVPASLPLSKGYGATIIATFGHLGRGAIMVLDNSPVKKTGDLNDKKVGVPFGSSPHRNLLGMLRKAGLKPGVDVEVLNVGRDEIAPTLLKEGVSAIMTWDPAVEQYRQKNKFRIIEAEPFYSVVIMNNKYIEQYPEAAVNFIKALKEAVFYWATHKNRVDGWFSEISRLDPEIIQICSDFNLNYKNVKKISDVDIALSEDFLEMMKRSAEFTAEQQMIPQFDITKAVNPELKKVTAEKLNDANYDPSGITNK